MKNYYMVIAGATVQDAPIVSSGDCTGDWVAQTIYMYRLAPHNTDKTKCAYQVAVKVNLEFSKGGSIEFQSMATFDLQEVVEKPMLMDLMQLTKDAAKELSAHFRQVFQVTGPTNGILDPEEDQKMAMAISKELTDAYKP